jgi:solute carrier family 9B (sodium/hydrogen exchanger), member 1/2
LDQIACPHKSREILGCGSADGTIPKTLPNYVGRCSCIDNEVNFDLAGPKIGKEFFDNRIKSDIFWLLDPPNGPPYNLNNSYENICTLSMKRLGCPAESVTMNSYGRSVTDAQGNSIAPYTCNCGSYTYPSARTAESIVDKINEALLMSTPVFSAPVTLSIETSLAIVFIAGKMGAIAASLIYFPPIIGFLLAGLCIQDYINKGLISGCGGNGPKSTPFAELRTLALIVVLMRAGLTLNLKDVIKKGVLAVSLAVVPYFAEFAVEYSLSKLFLGWSNLECGLLCSILAALSPSLVIPGMIKYVEEGVGYTPRQVLVSAPLEVVFSIILFNIFISLLQSSGNPMYPWVNPLPLWASIVLIPVNIAFSCVLGATMGFLVSSYIKLRSDPQMENNVHVKRAISNTIGDQLLPLLVACYTLYALCTPQYIQQSSGILAVFSCTLTCAYLLPPEVVENLKGALAGLWVFLEIILFTTTGINLSFESSNGPLQGQRGMSRQKVSHFVGILFLGALGRGASIFLLQIFLWGHVAPHRRNLKYLVAWCLATWMFQWPKATVQATLGGVPLQLSVLKGINGIQIATEMLQGTAFSVLLMAPIGVFLTTVVGYPLAKYLKGLDDEAERIHDKVGTHEMVPVVEPMDEPFQADNELGSPMDREAQEVLEINSSEI